MSTRTVQQIATDRLTCRPQVRESSGYSEDEIAGLARSMQESGGIHVPLLVRKDGDALIVLDGERRLRAAKQAGLKSVPVLISDEPLDEAAITQRQLVLDAQRVNLSPVERAKALQRLMDQSEWSAAQVALKLGLSPAQVSKLLTLLVLPASVQADIASGRLAMSTAYELAQVKDPQARTELTRVAVIERLSRDGVAKKRKQLAARPRYSGERASTTQRPTVLTMRPRAGQSVTYRGPALTRDELLSLLTRLAKRVEALPAAATGGADWQAALALPFESEVQA